LNDVGNIPLKVYFYYEMSIIALLGGIIRRNLQEKVIQPFWRDSSFRECPVEGATTYNTLWPHGMPQEVMAESDE
jgi:hypothetical protein